MAIPDPPSRGGGVPGGGYGSGDLSGSGRPGHRGQVWPELGLQPHLEGGVKVKCVWKPLSTTALFLTISSSEEQLGIDIH